MIINFVNMIFKYYFINYEIASYYKTNKSFMDFINYTIIIKFNHIVLINLNILFLINYFLI